MGVWGERGAHGFVAALQWRPPPPPLARPRHQQHQLLEVGTHASGRPSRSVSRLLLAGWAAAAQAKLTARATTRSLEGEGMGVQWFVVFGP